MVAIYVAGIEWSDAVAPLVYASDVLPLGRLTVLFGANDSGKSTTLHVLAEQLDALAERTRASGDCTAILSFREDRGALDALLEDLMRPDRDPSASWTLETLVDRPRLFRTDPPEVVEQLAQAPAFALSHAGHDEPRKRGRWTLTLVRSPAHEDELPPGLLSAIERRGRPHPAPRSATPLDPALLGPPLRPLHKEQIGETALPLIPKPLRLPSGLSAAFDALEVAVDSARRAFRRWAIGVGLPIEVDEVEMVVAEVSNDTGAWVGPDGEPDLFLLQLTGDLELHAWLCMPPFVTARYRLDFDASSPPRAPWATRLNARLVAHEQLRRHRTFANKFPADQVASGFQLWIEYEVWELVAEVQSATASLVVAACEDLASFLAHPGSPATRLELLRQRWLNPWREGEYVSWLPTPQEQNWQLHVLAAAERTNRTDMALDACAQAARPRMVLIDEPERHLNAGVAKDAAAWLQERVSQTGTQVIVATHSPAFLACRGAEVRHVHVARASDGLAYTSFSPAEQDALAAVASAMQLDHGELFGLTTAIVWVEGPMDRAVLEGLCGEELRRAGAQIAMFGGLGNIRSVLQNPLARLPNLRFVVLIDNLDAAQILALRTHPDRAGAKTSHEMRSVAQLLQQAAAEDRQLEVLSHGAPDVFLALADAALAETARGPWPGRDAVQRQAAQEGVPTSRLKGFVADRYGLRIDETRCRYAAELTRREGTPGWVHDLLQAVGGDA